MKVLYNRQLKLKSALIARKFLLASSKKMYLNLKKYSLATSVWGEQDHGFRYGEMQLRTFLIPAIFELTNGAVLQEAPLSRTHPDHDLENGSKNGRLDYWCIFENYQLLIEVKFGFVKLTNEDVLKFNPRMINKHIEAIIQINSIHLDTGFREGKRNVGIAVTYCPIYKPKDYFSNLTKGKVDNLSK